MDDLTCLGCSKAFPTQKSLDADVYKQQCHLEKQRHRKHKRKRAHEGSASPQGCRDLSCNAHRPSPDQMDVNIVDDDQWFDVHKVHHFE
jgi:hypothetical protein